MSRWQHKREARAAALQLLYQVQVGQLTLPDAARVHAAMQGTDEVTADDEQRALAGELARGVQEHAADLDVYIAEAATNWRVERLAVIERSVLRLAVEEWLHHPSTPPRVVLDEAIELARTYSGEEAARFVNGVLDGIFKRLQTEGKVVA